MMALVLALSLATAPAPAAAYKCAWDDTACWRAAALGQEERADRAERLLDLEKTAREVVQRMVKDEQDRGDRWQKTAMEIAPKAPAFYESPFFWGVIGMVVGGGVVVAATYATAPAHSLAAH